MINRYPFDLSTKRACSPLATVDLNLTHRTHTQYVLKSPPQEHHRLKRIQTYSENTSNLLFHNSYKQNLEPQSRPRLMFSVRSNQLQKKTPSVKFNLVATSVSKHTPGAYNNHSIRPFTLAVQEPDQIYENRQLCVQDFKKLRELGKGKFGTVWLAIHIKSNFLCALKIISKAVVRQEKVQHQVAKEIRIHNSLRNQNIIDFYGFFADKEYFYIVSEFATDGHLYGKIRKHHRLQEGQVRDYTRQTAEGLQAIHRRGFIHRDIKPQNLLLQFGTVKICDFGWAAECSGALLRKSQCGTPLYYSPEIVKKQTHNEKIDVWSLGLLAYELIVGRVPFKIWSQFDLHIIVEQEVSLPDYIDASNSLKEFVLACLIKDQQRRPGLEQLRKHPFLSKKTQASIVQDLYEAARRLL